MNPSGSVTSHHQPGQQNVNDIEYASHPHIVYTPGLDFNDVGRPWYNSRPNLTLSQGNQLTRLLSPTPMNTKVLILLDHSRAARGLSTSIDEAKSLHFLAVIATCLQRILFSF